MRGARSGPSGFLRCGRGTLLGAIAGSVCLLVAAASAPAPAQHFGPAVASGSDRANAPASKAPPDLEQGKLIATQGVDCGDGQACFPCYQCHGKEGAGDVGQPIPRLSGQSPDYLYESLRNFASGVRPNPVMREIAATLSDAAMRDVAAYFAAVEPATFEEAAAADALSSPDPETLVHGGVLGAVGDASRGVQACANCHGPQGEGLPPTYPYLAGQYADYLEHQLMAWKSGERGGDPLDIMRQIAGRLTDDEVRAVAQYYAAIRPSRPIAQQAGAAPEAASQAAGEAPAGKGGSQ